MKAITTLTLILLLMFSLLIITIPTIAQAAGTWSVKASMPTAKANFAAVAYGGNIFTFGGDSYSGPLASVEVYDPTTNSWTSKASMPSALETVGAALINNYIYVLGNKLDGSVKFYRYDPQMDYWEVREAPSVSSFGKFGYGIVNNILYIAYGSGTQTKPSWTYAFDPSTDTWIAKRPISDIDSRSIESFAVLNNKLYAIGGDEQTPGEWAPALEISRIDVYDPTTDTWQKGAVSEMLGPRTYLSPSMPVVNGKIYVIGGWDGYSEQSTVFVYDNSTNSWSSEVNMFTPRYALTCIAIDNQIFALGGDSGGAGGNWKPTNEALYLSSAGHILFQDNFEGYPIGSLPSPPWEFWYNNIGSIVNTSYASGTQSLRLQGSYGWSTEAIRRFSSASRYIGYEVQGMVESVAGPHSLMVSFIKKTSPTTGDMIAAVTFEVINGQPVIIAANGAVLQPYVANVWYKIRVIYDRDGGQYQVWIDDILKGTIPFSYANPYGIEGLALVSGWAGINCYFDNAQVFEAHP